MWPEQLSGAEPGSSQESTATHAQKGHIPCHRWLAISQPKTEHAAQWPPVLLTARCLKASAACLPQPCFIYLFVRDAEQAASSANGADSACGFHLSFLGKGPWDQALRSPLGSSLLETPFRTAR